MIYLMQVTAICYYPPTHDRGLELSLKLSMISEYVGSKIWQAYVGIWQQGRFASESRARSAGLGPRKKGAKSGLPQRSWGAVWWNLEFAVVFKFFGKKLVVGDIGVPRWRMRAEQETKARVARTSENKRGLRVAH